MTDEEQLKQQLRAATRTLPDPAPPPLDRVSARARVLKTRRYAGLVAAMLATTAAIVVPLLALSGIGRDAEDPAIGPLPGTGQVSDLPDVGVVICDNSGTRVATDRIRPQPDGVHFRTDNRTGRPSSFQIDGVGGTNAPPGIHDVEIGEPWSVAPGTIRLRCLVLDEDAGAEGGYVSMTIEDPDGLWIPDQVDCPIVGGSESSGGSENGGGTRGDPLVLAREHFASLTRPGDEVRKAGYPEASDPTYALVREGKTFATVRFNRDGQGGWFVGATQVCIENTLSVSCNERGTQVPDIPVVRRPDGVHLEGDNPLNRTVVLHVEGFGSVPIAPGLQALPYPPTGEAAWPIPSGSVRVRCEGGQVRANGPHGGWFTVRIIDGP